MKTSSALIKLIIFMVVTSVMTYTLAATIGNYSFGGTTYHVEFTDVTGVLPGQEVRIAGVKIGSVKKIKLAPIHDKNCSNSGRVADVTISLDAGHKLTDANTLAIRYRNLVGERYIAISEGAGTGTPLKPGATVCIQNKQGVTMTTPALDLTVLFNGFRPLFQALDPTTVNQVSFEIIQTLQGEGGTIDDLLAHTASLTTTLANKDAVIGRVVDNLTAVLDTIDKRDTNLSSLIIELRRLATGFAADRKTIGASIQGIGNLTQATTGLLADIRPGVRSDVQQLGRLAAGLSTPTNLSTINGTLQRLPDKLNRIVATATYGSWFNFYLCGINITKPNSSGGNTSIISLRNTASRCNL